ncbi:MAG: hypothetical protein SVE93_01745, partial [Candidatus Thermoplasmatota archaeon]|nr:hypothetical protein [Candidatus Thermoplasmatota archaeon]
QRCAFSFKGVILLSLHGRLKWGSVADIDVNGAKREIEDNGADLVVVSKSITTEEKPVIAAAGNTREEIEAKLFSELFDDVVRAKSLFSELSIDPEEVSMSKSDFKREIEKRGFRFFDLEEEDDN